MSALERQKQVHLSKFQSAGATKLDPVIQKAETRKSGVSGQPQLHNQTLSKKFTIQLYYSGMVGHAYNST